MRAIRLFIFAAAAAVTAGACGDNNISHPDAQLPACSDGEDNDGDGLIDFPADPGCESAEGTDEARPIKAECDDDRDNDGDGLIDYPADPGCLAPQQEDESDDCPTGPNCPQCANGIDDDSNGSIDYPADPGCMAASDPTEFPNNPAACGAGLTIKPLPSNGMDSGTLDSTSVSNVASPCGGGASSPAIAYQISLTQPKVIVASTQDSAIDTVLDLRGAACADPGSEVACNDDISTSDDNSELTVSVPAGNYFLIVQGHDSSVSGAYELEVQFFTGEGLACTDTAQCGPGLVCRTPVGAAAMICTQPACRDGLDDDADGEIDYPADPGCTSLDDNDEVDDCPAGPTCPQCSNGIDDDLDGLTDYPTDTSCAAASGSSEACEQSEPVNVITAGATLGTTVGQVNDFRPPPGSFNGRLCSTSSTTGHTAPDVAYVLDLPAMRQLNLDIDFPSSTWDSTSILLGASCGGTPIACSDSPTHLPRTNLAEGRYYVVVDGYSTASGAFQLNVDGEIAPGGRCDLDVTLGGALTCPAANPCEGAVGMMRCRPTLCNDGIDNDTDGLIDFPLDPGCSTAFDEDESDTCPGVGPGCPECADGTDNDGDGQIDFPQDTNCTSLSMNSEGCMETDGVTALETPTYSGTTVGATNDVVPTCGSSTTQTAPDHTFSLVLPPLRQFTILNDNSFDATVSLLGSTCAGTPLICNDTPEHISLNNLPGGNYYYVIDGWSSGTGTYDLTISGIIQNGGSCEVPLAQSGALTCATGYTCRGTPGARICQQAECADGIDNDLNGVADYPNDPGCSSPTDDDETTVCPGAPGCPECSDGVDNDADGSIDYPADPSCFAAAASSEACFSSEAILALTEPETDGTLVGATNDWFPACGGSFPHSAPDLLYSLELPALTTLTIDNANSFDAVISMFQDSCETTEIFCADEPENLTLVDLAAGTYYYLVDGDGSAANSYTISVSGMIAGGESCESPLAQSGALICGAGFTCAGTMGARTCMPAACNDGMDNDTDGLTDYPFDPGCESTSDDDETDPAVAPVCANSLDDDGDGFTDFPDDVSCTSASGMNESCAQTEPVATITAAATMGTTVGQTNDIVPDCGSSTTQTAPDVAYALPIPAMATLTVTLSQPSYWDSVHSVLGPSCAGAPLRCSDSLTMPTLTNVGPGTYYVVVDGYSSANGAFTINTSGTVAPGGSCEGALFQAGVFTCVAGTTCDGTVGARTCRSQCSDGIDNNLDGLTDHPYDPACSSAADNTEDTVCVGAACPVCSNTTDDDADTLIDFPADHGCSSAGGTSEAFCPAETNPTAVITSSPITGTTTGMTSNFNTATSDCSTSSGEDVAYALSLPVPVEKLVLDLDGPGWDTVVALRDAQCTTLLGCDRNSGPGTASRLELSGLRAGNYAVVVDGYSLDDGAYTLSVQGTVAAGTACDSPLFTSGVLACKVGTTCTGTPATCQ